MMHSTATASNIAMFLSFSSRVTLSREQNSINKKPNNRDVRHSARRQKIKYLTLMYSIGHTAVASIPPAIHPADMGKRGFVFLLAAMIGRCCWSNMATKDRTKREGETRDHKRTSRFGGGEK
jgi:hypothetical protein